MFPILSTEFSSMTVNSSLVLAVNLFPIGNHCTMLGLGTWFWSCQLLLFKTLCALYDALRRRVQNQQLCIPSIIWCKLTFCDFLFLVLLFGFSVELSLGLIPGILLSFLSSSTVSQPFWCKANILVLWRFPVSSHLLVPTALDIIWSHFYP